MIRRKKRGLSPVVATVLLIAIGIVLALIILLWARNFIGEKAQKFGEAIENSCKNVNFVADISGGKINVNNIGNVPLYGLEVRVRKGNNVEVVGTAIFNNGLPKGSGTSEDIGGTGTGEIIALPIILGETSEFKKTYTCGEEFAKVVESF